MKLGVRPGKPQYLSLATDRYRPAFHTSNGRTHGLIIEADVCKQLECTLYVTFRAVAHTWPRNCRDYMQRQEYGVNDAQVLLFCFLSMCQPMGLHRAKAWTTEPSCSPWLLAVWQLCEGLGSGLTGRLIPYILEPSPHPFYSFGGLKNQMRIRIAVVSWNLEKW